MAEGAEDRGRGARLGEVDGEVRWDNDDGSSEGGHRRMQPKEGCRLRTREDAKARECERLGHRDDVQREGSEGASGRHRVDVQREGLVRSASEKKIRGEEAYGENVDEERKGARRRRRKKADQKMEKRPHGNAARLRRSGSNAAIRERSPRQVEKGLNPPAGVSIAYIADPAHVSLIAPATLLPRAAAYLPS